MKLVSVPLRDFAVPVPRTGSIEAHSGYGRAALEGQEIHLRVQKRRAKGDPSYQAEVPVSIFFEREGFRFQIDGRMDGIFRQDPALIEEIKSAFNIRDLLRRLSNPLAHPYGLQLLTYGYIWWRENGAVPKLSFHLVSSRNGDSCDFEINFDPASYEAWLALRLDELLHEARQADRRSVRRRKVAADFPFPFDNPRPGQTELMWSIEEGMAEGRRMLLQAPTGLGKTVGVLYPVLREALARGQRVVYVTPKNSQHTVAEEAIERFRERGASLKTLSITAKGKICFKEEPLCSAEYCEYARDYYRKIHEHGLLDLLAKKRKLKARTFRQLGEEYEVCPFELQIDGAREADVVICDYNYVFSPRSALGRMIDLVVDMSGKPNLVIDEAHNLPHRAMDCYSPALSSLSLEKMREEVRQVAPRFRWEAEALLDASIRTIASCRNGKTAKAVRIDPPTELFVEHDARLRAFLSQYLEADVEIRSNDPVLRLVYSWGEFTATQEYAADPERDEFFTTFHPHPGGGTIRITCCDAGGLIAERYRDYQHVVAFSATLKPFDYYAKLSGLDPAKLRMEEFPTPFPKEHRKLLIIPQISTKYGDRERNYVRIADAVARIAALRTGNYFVFLSSFDFLDRVATVFQPPTGFSMLRQERGMKGAHLEMILDHLREAADPTIVFAVQGGSFAEGIDYAGDMVIGAFVVGPPLPTFDLERELMRGYYERKYGAGFDYAYTIPAMAKAVQAAGRVIRSETDRGIIVLMDNRFLDGSYSSSMPADWFAVNPDELVSARILKDISDFWTAE